MPENTCIWKSHSPPPLSGTDAHSIENSALRYEVSALALCTTLPNFSILSRPLIGGFLETLLTLIHVLVAILIIGLVLIQDSKGGALGIGGGSTSNSLLGAGGAQTLAAKATCWVGVIFAITCITLSLWTAKKTQSVVSGALPIPAATAPATQDTTTAPAAPTTPSAPETK